VVGAVLLGALVLLPGVASASGGGGCGQPVTDATASGVDIEDFCFSPTIVRIGVGDAVTFTNVDPFPHSVLGANATWGDYAGFKKKSVTYRFSEPGVYPYVCTYHLGMVGVVVVGDGVGGAIDTPQPGVYRVLVHAAGYTLRGEPFTREELRTAAVWARGDTPPEQPGGRPGGLDVSGLLDCLLSDRGIERWAKERNVDVERLRECLRKRCS
jgi:plastocyanin